MKPKKETSQPLVDMLPANELQTVQIRLIAEAGADSLQQTLTAMQDNSAAMGRWILASLLAMNSGAAVAALSASDKVVGPIGTSLVAFAVGASFALATGINGLATSIRLGPKIGEAIELLRLSAVEGVIHGSTRQKIADFQPIARQQIFISSILASASLASFFVGVATAV